LTIQLYANNAKTTLAAGITATTTTIKVAAGTGALFPNPSSGQAFKVTLVSSTSATVFEICLCTSRSGDTLTVVRGQEGTSKTPFLIDDIVGNYDTAGVMDDLVQSVQLQNQYYIFAVASGSANALTATIPSNLTALTDGMSIVVKSAYANTSSATLNLTLGSTATGVKPVVVGNNSALTGNEIPGAGYPITLSYSSTFDAWVVTDGNVNLTLYALINSQTFTGTPRVPTPAFNDTSTIIPNTLWVQNQLANYAPIYSPTLTGVPAAPTAANGTSTTQIATTAFVQNQLQVVQGLGFGGTTWHIVSRGFNTQYTNSYSYPIAVSATTTCSTGSSIQVYINGQFIQWFQWQFNGCGSYGGAFVIVPPGATYQLNSGQGVYNWAELY